MKSVFIESSIFEKFRDTYISEEEFRLFQADLMANPKQGDVIQGTGGLRKIRVAGKDKGKRGGSRVIYPTFRIKFRNKSLGIMCQVHQ